MSTDVTALAPLLPPAYTETTRVREVAARQVETLDLTFTDPAGRAVRLSVERETSVYALTYDHRALLTGGGPGADREITPGNGGLLKEFRGGLGELRHDLTGIRHDLGGALNDMRTGGTYEADELSAALREMRVAVNGFKKLLHRFLKAVDPRYADTYRVDDPVEAGIRAFEHEHAGILAVRQTVTISVEGAPDADEWSVEATARRLVDFATGLFPGGDRGEHLERMVDGMEQGYREAAKAFGGMLPPVARETVDLAEALLERWALDGGSETTGPEPGRFEAVA